MADGKPGRRGLDGRARQVIADVLAGGLSLRAALAEARRRGVAVSLRTVWKIARSLPRRSVRCPGCGSLLKSLPCLVCPAIAAAAEIDRELEARRRQIERDAG